MEGTWKKQKDCYVWTTACPLCGGTIATIAISAEQMSGATFDCQRCGAELLDDPEAGVVELHAFIHSKDPAWPADGEGTGYVDLREKMTDLGLGK